MTNRTDDFNRADNASTLGSPSDGGSAWSALAGTWGIASNAAYTPSASGEAWAVLDSSSSAVDVQVTYTTFENDAGLCARASDQYNGLMVAVYTSSIAMYKLVAGSYTQLGSTYSGSVASGDVIKFRCDSSNALTAYQNGVARVGPVTDSAHATNTKHGLRVWNGHASMRADDFSITDIVAAAASLVYYQPAIAPLLVR